ncbi:MAG: hypothetical protein K2J18_02095 [Paramuribaculum sp.]|nr:hypothetical protein [Bacteroides sp.]MDE6825537.1 hypothetical protein [Paramuribaculum sp.]MDE7470602.1 hypothetical protein [Paramuribaculum sp.]
MKSLLNALIGNLHKEQKRIERTTGPSRPHHHTETNEGSLLNHVSSTPPKIVSGTIAEKDELARWLVATLVKSGSVSLPFMLERMLDVRICSMVAYYLATELFSSYGATFAVENEAVVKALGLHVEIMPSGRIADIGQTASPIMPAKYRGYGNPMNSPESRGHLFQVNMCSFAEKNPVIGYQDWLGSPIIPFKGMTPCGSSGAWKLFELDQMKTDDMTAVFLCPSKGNIQIELSHFKSDEDTPRMFYRQSTLRGTAIEKITKEYDEEDDV